MLATTRCLTSAALLLLLLVACVPVRFGSHFRPSYDGPGAALRGPSCAGTAGPPEMLMLTGPAKAIVQARITRDRAGLGAEMELHAPREVRLALLGDDVALAMPRPSGADSAWTVRVDRMTVYVNVHDGPRTPESRAPVPSFAAVVDGGSGRRGTSAWLRFAVADRAFGVPAWITLRLPPLSITDRAGVVHRHEPALVTSHHRDGAWGLMPVNC